MCFLSMWCQLECATSSILLPFGGGCFNSISVNMAEIMPPNLTNKLILFVKPVWYSSHSQLNHLVAVFALSLWNITLSDLVVLSLATSLKWVMIINPTGHVRWNHIDLPAHKCIYAYLSIDKQAPEEAEKNTLLLKYFISHSFLQINTSVSAHMNTTDTYRRFSIQGMFNQPRSLCVALRCCWRSLWEKKGNISHLYSFHMVWVMVGSCRYRIFFFCQTWDTDVILTDFHKTQLNVIYSSAVSIPWCHTGRNPSLGTMHKNSPQFELVEDNPLPPMSENLSASPPLLMHTSNIRLFDWKQECALPLIVISLQPLDNRLNAESIEYRYISCICTESCVSSINPWH